ARAKFAVNTSYHERSNNMPRQFAIKALTFFSLLVLLCLTASGARAQSVRDFVSVDAARYSQVAAPNSIVAGFTSQVATEVALANDADDLTPGIQLPTELGGLSVSVNGRLAPLFFVSPNQINYVVPAETETDGPATVVVTDAQGTVLAQGTLNMATKMLSVFCSNQGGTGAPAGSVTPDGINYAPVGNPDGTSNVVPAGQYLVLYGTGISGTQEDVKAFIGGVEAPVTYAGLQGGFVGLCQVNLQIPESLANQGLLELQLVDGSTVSNTMVIDLGGNPTAPAGAPVITGLSANQALAGQVVTLTGSNFPTSIDQATVRLGPAYGQVLSTKATELTFIVPYGAATNRIAVGNAAGERLSSSSLGITTSISGTVQAADGTPLVGLPVYVTAANAYTTTDFNGRFLLSGVTAGVNRVEFDASSRPYTSESFSLLVNEGRDNELGFPVTLLQDLGGYATYGSQGDGGLESTAEDPTTAKVIEHEGLTLTIPGKVTFPNGTNQGRIGLTRIPRDGRLVSLLPAGVYPSVVALITPPGATFGENGTGLASLTFPNVDQLPAGTKFALYAYDRKVTPSAFVKKGQATVNQAGDKVVAESLIDVATVWFIGLPAENAPVTKVTGRVLDSNDKPVSGARVYVRGRGAATDVRGNFVINSVRAKNGDELRIEVLFSTPAGSLLKAGKAVNAVVPGETSAGDIKLPAEPELMLLIRPGEVKMNAGETTTMKVVLSRALSADATINLAKVDGVAVTLDPTQLKIEAGKTESGFTVKGSTPGRAVIAATLASATADITTDQARGAKAYVYVLAPAPVLTGITPPAGPSGSPFAIVGSGFSSEARYNQIVFKQGDHLFPVDPAKVGIISTPNGVTGLKGVVPGMKAGAAEVFVVRYQEGTVSAASNTLAFTVTEAPAPVLTSITPGEGKPGTQFTLTGSGFSSEAKYDLIFFKQGDRVFPVDPTTIKVITATSAANTVSTALVTGLVGNVPRMPAGAAEVYVVVFRENGASATSNRLAFNVLALPAPEVKSITPGEGQPGATFTLTGSGFASEASRNYVIFRKDDVKTPVDPKTLSVTADTIKGVVPRLAAGDYKVSVVVVRENIGGVPSNEVVFIKVGDKVVTLYPTSLKVTDAGITGLVPDLPAGDGEVWVVTRKDDMNSPESNHLRFTVKPKPVV